MTWTRQGQKPAVKIGIANYPDERAERLNEEFAPLDGMPRIEVESCTHYMADATSPDCIARLDPLSRWLPCPSP